MRAQIITPEGERGQLRFGQRVRRVCASVVTVGAEHRVYVDGQRAGCRPTLGEALHAAMSALDAARSGSVQ